jgi:peptidoglycan/xylan/chitin deacetylase (PgdA/CDA1 family)
MKPLIFILLLASFTATAQQKIKWPNHKKAVIVLTYDDALQTQLDTAVPQLKKAGFKATFFLTGDMDYVTMPRWRALGNEGFELANHTIYHPCLSTDDNLVHSENYTVAGMINEIETMNHLLFALDGKTGRTFAYPCTETVAGGIDYVDTLRTTRMIKYARLGGDTDDAVITDFTHLDPLRVPSYGLEDKTPGDKLIAFVKLVEQKGGMGIFMFHGIGGDYITTSTKAHQQLLNYLVKNHKHIWVTTFQNAMDYAEAHK